MIVFGTVNYGTKPRPQPALQQQASLAPIFSTAKETIKETVVYRAPEQRQSFQDRWEQARVFFSEAESEAEPTIERLDQTGSRADRAREESDRAGSPAAEDKIGALAFAPPTGSGHVLARVGDVGAGWPLDDREAFDEAATEFRRRARLRPALDEVERYLWEVYQRAPVKKDGSGDFTWKDPVAAKRFGKSMPAYVIGGMDPDFKEQLYHAGKAMDAAGVQWAILSAFRDDYRQSLASGFKASARNSLHGGSARVGGYGHGRAVDVTAARRQSEPVWKWLDAHGGEVRSSPSDARQRSGACPVARRLAQARAGAAGEPHADRRGTGGQDQG